MPKKKKKQLTEEEARQLKLDKLRKFWEAANDEFGLSDKTVVEQVHILVDAADELMCTICEQSDKIKIDDLAKVQELTPIDKKTYLDFVNICALKNNDSLKEKAIAKFEEDFAKRLFITNLRHSFLESYMNGDELKITDEDNEEYKPFTDYESDDFNEIMQDSAKTREYLNTCLWRQYKSIAKAAEYATSLELSYADFKKLVDWQHYKNGGYPSPASPSKIWSVFNTFNHAHRLLSKYEYDETRKELCKEFGLVIEEVTPQPVDHPWQMNANAD